MRDEEESIELYGFPKGNRLETIEEPEIADIELVAANADEPNSGGGGVKYYLLCLLMGSLMTASSKLAMKDADVNVVMFSRMLGTFCLAALWMFYKKIPHFFWGPPGLRMILGVRGFAGTLNLALVYYAIQFIPLPDYSLINFLAPLLTAFAARIVLGEPYHWAQAVASCISLGGVVVITRPSFIFGESLELPEGVTPHQHTIAVICLLIQVVGTAVVILTLRKMGTSISPYSVVSNYALQTCILSIGGVIIKVCRHEHIQVPTKIGTWFLLVLVGIVGFIYQYLLSYSYARERASVLGQLDYLMLLYMMVWQFLIFHTLPDLVSIGGGALILAGVLWAAHVSRREN